jgi:hypothetical protein
MKMPVAHSVAFPERPRHAARPGSVRARKKTVLRDRLAADQLQSTSGKTFTRRFSVPRAVRKPIPAPCRRLTPRHRFTP